jgi:hypothetical protein
MWFHNRITRNFGVSYGPLGGLFMLLVIFFIWLTALEWALLGIMFIVAMFLLGYSLCLLIALYGVIFKKLTGKDARVPIPGSEWGTAIEFWMEDKGWVRLPERIQGNRPLKPMTTTEVTLSLYGESGLRKKEVSPRP